MGKDGFGMRCGAFCAVGWEMGFGDSVVMDWGLLRGGFLGT